jgi:putative acetyltransferase
MIVAPERLDHHAAVRDLLLSAFPSADEADLVERLRRDGDAVISLVATDDDRVVGHVMLSRMIAPFRALGLAPVAVSASWRKRGVAAALIEAGLRQATADHWQAVFVLGDPAYYRRFGFSAEAAEGFDCRYAGPHLMVRALAGDQLPADRGRIDYAPAFAALG